jgi:putative nucleotidyltransferase with HDIG domain
MQTKHPDKYECYKMLQDYGTPANVVMHCKAVANAGLKMAFALNKKGFYLNTTLVLSAGLLHDIARVSEEHWNVGADYVLQSGYFKEAEIIRQHMHHSHDIDPQKLKEIDMVCLGDRLIMEDSYVGLDARMDYAIRKAGGVKWIEDIINEKREINRVLIQNIENILEISIETLINGDNY